MPLQWTNLYSKVLFKINNDCDQICIWIPCFRNFFIIFFLCVCVPVLSFERFFENIFWKIQRMYIGLWCIPWMYTANICTHSKLVKKQSVQDSMAPCLQQLRPDAVPYYYCMDNILNSKCYQVEIICVCYIEQKYAFCYTEIRLDMLLHIPTEIFFHL